MEAVSQVVLRNHERLGDGPVLLVDMPADGLATALRDAGRTVRASNQEHGPYRALAATGIVADFETTPQARTDETLVILRLPREKDRFAMVLHALAASLAPAARLWVVGEKRAGVNSAARLLESRFAAVSKLDSARHCSLLEARAPRTCPPFRLDDYAATFRCDTPGGALTLCALPGVFAQGRLDDGSALLLEVLEDCQIDGDVLDFACGNGVLGISLLRRPGGLRMTLLDHSALAIQAARRSLVLNECAGRLLASHGLDELEGAFDWIVSNPPFHRGVDDDLDVAADFLRRAGTFLRPDGKILVVYNRHLPYERWARARFHFVDRLANSRAYTVIRASKPR